MKNVRAPLFPHYLFVRDDTQATQWRPIISSLGVQHLVMHRDTPPRFPNGALGDIRDREDENYLVRRSAPVNTVADPFAGLISLFDCLCNKHRNLVLLDLLGRQVKTLITTRMASAAA